VGQKGLQDIGRAAMNETKLGGWIGFCGLFYEFYGVKTEIRIDEDEEFQCTLGGF
jgi:hypothetical protein